ncbi:hypothetical protein A3D72_01730 [Candidatus Uhrbacteria bacterium RIFCSPHIGHO2_02_FULL_57_19]|uniref:Homeodomain phBC6A51-type domain-containing protein n=2 Tax=Parcubacteria group TaxID=1794811 RepID=A0A1F6CQ81_9BACT|nr:MAG: hypothetical protein A2704_01495 [Candidatus Kaiserbacteria bacterium RIFCSPHIGHO2_01_FULL_54_36b]OGL73866.1 MAG: hypothetical protein A3D72_01730 [Candidatus Uhrbacteria bacterium RIFCSPHIGHO2_02_FULL_57_19]
MKKDRLQTLFLEQLTKLPIISIAAEKAGVARRTVYNWREDPEFAKQMEAAIEEGEALLNDLGESQLVSLMRDRNWPAISFWLRHRNPKFRDKLEVTARIEKIEELPPEQKEALKKYYALRDIEIKDHEQK